MIYIKSIHVIAFFYILFITLVDYIDAMYLTDIYNSGILKWRT